MQFYKRQVVAGHCFPVWPWRAFKYWESVFPFRRKFQKPR